METKKLLFIINPVSGKKVIYKYLPQVIRIFMDGGYTVTTMVTAARGEATTFARRFGKDYDLVVCSGGDGTLNETITGLWEANCSVPLGYIPCGSTNDFAASHGIPVEPEQAAMRIVRTHTEDYDVGQFDARCFVYVAAFGAFSAISYNTDQNLKNMVGHAAYLMGGLRELSQIKAIPMRVIADGEVFEGDWLFGAILNTNTIGGTLSLPDELVDLSDGMLEVLLVRLPEDLIELDEIVHGLLEQQYDSPLLTLIRAKEITCEALGNPVEWSLDGEEGGAFTSVSIRAVPTFLHLCV